MFLNGLPIQVVTKANRKPATAIQGTATLNSIELYAQVLQSPRSISYCGASREACHNYITLILQVSDKNQLLVAREILCVNQKGLCCIVLVGRSP